MSEPTTVHEKKVLRKRRVNSNLITGLIVFPVMFAAFYWSDDLLQAVAQSGETVHALPIETVHPLFLVFVYVSGIAMFSHLIASLTDQMFPPKAFGSSWSRYAAVYLSCFLACSFVAGSIL